MNKLDLEETTRRFHNVYEQVAKEYGYKTREDTKELDFNSPNGMTMLKTVETITTPYLEEIERLNNIINELSKENQELNNGLKDIKWYIEKGKTSFSDLFIPASDVVSILVIINRLLGSDK